MKRFLITILAALMLAVTAYSAPPQKAGTASPKRGVRLTGKQLETIRAFHPWMGKNPQGRHPMSTTAKYRSLLPSAYSAGKGVNPSGSKIQGWRTTYEYSATPAVKGWYELDLDGTQTFRWDYHDPDWVDDGWGEEPDFPFNTGFMRNGKVYGFHGEMVIYWLVWGHGSFTLDGEIEDYEQFGDDFSVTDFSTYVISCAYDEENDKVYAYTLNSDASAYQLQSVNPDTWEFTVINSNVPTEDICIGFSYNPVDKKLYGLTPDARFVTLDTATGTLSQVAKFGLPVNTSVYGMTYSPLDKKFVAVIPASDETSDLYTIDPLNPQLDKHATLLNTVQCRILVTPDKLLAPGTPGVAEILSVEFNEGSTSGTATVKLPAKTFDGVDLSGNLTLNVSIDGARQSELNALPGATVEVPFENIEEGMRKFSFSVTAGGLESAQVDRSLYVGFDTPLAPREIELEEGVLTWQAPEGTIHNGYLDREALTYNVYLNGEKINSEPVEGCSYTFTMPDAVFQKYVAQVEAVNHGHVSDRGFSNDIKYGNPFPLPFSMTPTEAESELVTVVSERNIHSTWHWISDEDTGGYFSCRTMDYSGPRDEWLYMPAVTVPESDKLLEISFDVQTAAYEVANENLSVGFAASQNPEETTIVKKWENLDSKEWERLTVWCLPQPGTSYIVFHTKTGETGNEIRISNISVKVSERSVNTPAAVEGLVAESLPQGALKANVSFTMPTLNAAGGELNDQNLTATVATQTETKTVSGALGSQQNVEIATVDGVNRITVAASNGNEGLEAVTTVFTGVDIPEPISVYSVGHTADFKGMHVEWEDPSTGVNGGYVNPDDVTYALCMFNEETCGWEIVQDLGNVNSYDAYFDVPEGMATAQIGIVSQNEKGNCGTLLTLSSTVGTPYSLPMEETFSQSFGEKYTGYVVVNFEESNSQYWGYVSESCPYWVEKETPYGPGAYVVRGIAGQRNRIILPAFTTEGVTSAGIELPLYAKKNAGKIRVYASAYGMEPLLIGEFEGTEEPEWVRKRYTLPAVFENRKWVEIMIDAEFTSEEETVVGFAQYRIQRFVADDILVKELSAPQFPVIGNTYEVTAKVENAGLEATGSPEVELQLTGSDGKSRSITMTRADEGTSLAELEEATYTVQWAPDAEMTGEVTLKVMNLREDMNPANDSQTVTVSVARGNSTAVTDLAANGEESGVRLTWTEPTVEKGQESFENFAPFSYGDRIGDFKFVNLDGYESNYFANFSFPYQLECKAWQVMSEQRMTEIIEAAGYENDFMRAYDGDRFLVAFSPYTVFSGEELAADRWIISPEVKGGTEFSFHLSSGASGQVEYVEVLSSRTGDNPEDFTVMEEYTLMTAEWREYRLTLPEDAKYFAIRYKGTTPSGFFVLLDDIRFVSAGESPVIEGYDIYRNGVLAAENAKASSMGDGTALFADAVQPAESTFYQIKPVLVKNGNLTRGLMSNTAYVSLSGISEIETDADGEAEYYTLQGFRVLSPEKGIYIKRKNGKAVKVVVR